MSCKLGPSVSLVPRMGRGARRQTLCRDTARPQFRLRQLLQGPGDQSPLSFIFHCERGSQGLPPGAHARALLSLAGEAAQGAGRDWRASLAGGAGGIVNRASPLAAVGKQGTTAGQQQVEAVGITLRWRSLEGLGTRGG